MEDLMNVASYIYNIYKSENGTNIDEMKLHKLMYFAQRESLIQDNRPLFDAVFYGWKFGPILKEIRIAYRDSAFYDEVPDAFVVKVKDDDGVTLSVCKPVLYRDTSLFHETSGFMGMGQ